MIGWKRIFSVFKLIMVPLYLVLGVVILSSDGSLLPINNGGRIAFGVVLILYGFFRGYSYYNDLKREK